jgi:hypothetical protein
MAAATDGKLLIALECEGGEPDLRELEPGPPLAQAN